MGTQTRNPAQPVRNPVQPAAGREAYRAFEVAAEVLALTPSVVEGELASTVAAGKRPGFPERPLAPDPLATLEQPTRRNRRGKCRRRQEAPPLPPTGRKGNFPHSTFGKVHNGDECK